MPYFIVDQDQDGLLVLADPGGEVSPMVRTGDRRVHPQAARRICGAAEGAKRHIHSDFMPLYCGDDVIQTLSCEHVQRSAVLVFAYSV